MTPACADALARLRVLAPTVFPVRLFVQGRVEVEGDLVCGSLEVGGKGRARRFLLRLRKGPPRVMLDTLLHEYGHALAWPAIVEHGPCWGVHYAAAYKAAMGAE